MGEASDSCVFPGTLKEQTVAWGPHPRRRSSKQLLFLLTGRHLVFFVLRCVRVVGRTQDVPLLVLPSPSPSPNICREPTVCPGG